MAVTKGGSLAGANLSLFFLVYLAWTVYSSIPFMTTELGAAGAAIVLAGIFIGAAFGALTALKVSLLMPAVIALGALTIVVPLAYVITSTVSNSLPTGSLASAQGQQLQQLVNSGASALSLSSVSLTVVAAGIIILGIYFFMNFTTNRYMEQAS